MALADGGRSSPGLVQSTCRSPICSHTRDILLSLQKFSTINKLPAVFDDKIFSELCNSPSSTSGHQSPRPLYFEGFKQEEHRELKMLKSSKNHSQVGQEKWVAESSGSNVSVEEEAQPNHESVTQESFELMIRQQQKALQKKQEMVPYICKKDLDTNVVALPENQVFPVGSEENIKSSNIVSPILQPKHLCGSKLQVPVSRPLLPPGFRAISANKIFHAPTSSKFLKIEGQKPGSNEVTHLAETASAVNIVTEQDASKTSLEESQNFGTSHCSSVTNLWHGSPSVLKTTKGQMHHLTGGPKDENISKVAREEAADHCHSASILDKLIESALTGESGGLYDIIESQKERKAKGFLPFVKQDTVPEYFRVLDAKPGHVENAIGSPSTVTTGLVNNAENLSTLEASFGSALTNELQIAEAPVSGRWNSVPFNAKAHTQCFHQLPFSHFSSSSTNYTTSTILDPADDDSSDSVDSIDELLYLCTHYHQIDGTNASGCKYQRNPCKDEANSPKYETPHLGGLLRTANMVNSIKRSTDMPLPEVNLIRVGDASNPTYTEFVPVGRYGTPKEMSTKTHKGTADKLAAINSICNDGRTALLPRKDRKQSLPTLCGQSNICPSCQQLYGNFPSSELQQFRISHPSYLSQVEPQISHAEPLFPQFESHGHINPHKGFMNLDDVHDLHPSCLPNMVHHQSTSIPYNSRFSPAYHHRMLQQTSVPGNFPPLQLHGYPEGIPPSHHFDQVSCAHKMNIMHGFPLYNQPLDYNGLGAAFAGPLTGSRINLPGPPENLLDMKLQAHFVQNHPVADYRVPYRHILQNIGSQFR